MILFVHLCTCQFVQVVPGVSRLSLQIVTPPLLKLHLVLRKCATTFVHYSYLRTLLIFFGVFSWYQLGSCFIWQLALRVLPAVTWLTVYRWLQILYCRRVIPLKVGRPPPCSHNFVGIFIFNCAVLRRCLSDLNETSCVGRIIVLAFEWWQRRCSNSTWRGAEFRRSSQCGLKNHDSCLIVGNHQGPSDIT